MSMIEREALPGTGVGCDAFWQGLSALVHELGPKNRALLARRDELQAAIDAWHRERRGQPLDASEYTKFLTDIGYLQPEGPAFSVDTQGVDPEIATIPGPQLVVPVMNARYALNAANARWGSLYDALYGTDAMGDAPGPGGYDPVRGARVIAWAKKFLDEVAPLASGSHADVTAYAVAGGALQATTPDRRDGPEGSPGFRRVPRRSASPSAVLLKHNHLHLEIVVDRAHNIGSADKAGVADVLLEAAITTIMDCEDSVAAVDAEDKALAYRNWLGLMNGTLVETVAKGGGSFQRKLNPDRDYLSPAGAAVTLKGRSLMLVRNVGHLMTNPAVLDREGREAYEGLLDAMCTVLIAMHDLRKTSGLRNSVAGSVYIVKPKMHGPAGSRPLPTRSSANVERCAGAAGQHGQDGHHGRGTPHDGEPEGVHPCGPLSAWCSSTPASWTAPATRSIPRCKPVRWCARAR
jgi:malate synthase